MYWLLKHPPSAVSMLTIRYPATLSDTKTFQFLKFNKIDGPFFLIKKIKKKIETDCVKQKLVATLAHGDQIY